jgi:hypothetical protein
LAKPQAKGRLVTAKLKAKPEAGFPFPPVTAKPKAKPKAKPDFRSRMC